MGKKASVNCGGLFFSLLAIEVYTLIKRSPFMPKPVKEG